MMKNLPNMDLDTLVYIIENNNLSKDDYELILKQSSKAILTKQQNPESPQHEDHQVYKSAP